MYIEELQLYMTIQVHETIKVHFDSLVCHLVHVFGCGITELVCVTGVDKGQ